jgi:hypothetical protein
MLEYMTCECIALQINPSYRTQYADVAAIMSVSTGMTNASTDDLYSLMEFKKRMFEKMEREIRRESAMESDASGMSAPVPAATVLPAGCSIRSSLADIPRGEVALPSLKQKKKRKRERGPLANATDLVQELFGEVTPETISIIQRGIETLLSEANALPVTFVEGAKIWALY